MIEHILLAFIPIFVAVDPIGLLPIFVTLTDGIDRKQRAKIIFQSMVTAVCLAVGFIIMGRAVFHFLGITIADFKIAGGAVLFCIAMLDLLTQTKYRRRPAEMELGAVPIGTPLIVGPAVLTTSLIMIEQHGSFITAVAVLLNILLVAVIFTFSEKLMSYLGKAGSNALSKVFALFLAAIAVMMIRKGIEQIVAPYFPMSSPV